MTHAPATRQQLLSAALAEHAAQTPDGLAYAYLPDGLNEAARLTWAELQTRALGLAAVLRDRIDAGDRALLLLPAGLDFVVATQACFLAGVVGVAVAPPAPRTAARDLANVALLAADADAALVLTIPELDAAVATAAAAFPVLAPLAALPMIHVAEAPAEAVDPWWAAPDPSDLAFLQYTSGSTSAPRGVMLTHAVLAAHAAEINALVLGRAGDCPDQTYTWTPPWHDMGLVNGIFSGLASGNPTRIAPPHAIARRPLTWLQALSDFEITASGGPDFIYRLCAERATPEFAESLDLSRWKTAYCGAEPIRPTTPAVFSNAFAAAGFRPGVFDPGYGLAEAVLLVTSPPSDEVEPARTVDFDRDALARGVALPAEAGSTSVFPLVDNGIPLPATEVAIVDPQSHRRLEEGQVGELWINRFTVGSGYWRREEETEAAFRAEIDGEPGTAWLRTGDLGFFHDRGLFIAGRIKDVLIINGVNLHAVDIESVAKESHPELHARPATAFGVRSDQTGGEGLVLAIEVPRAPLDDAALDAAFTAARRAIASTFGLQAQRVVGIASGQIPKTTSGKVQRAACRQALAAGELEVVWEWTAPERSQR